MALGGLDSTEFMLEFGGATEATHPHALTARALTRAAKVANRMTYHTFVPCPCAQLWDWLAGNLFP